MKLSLLLLLSLVLVCAAEVYFQEEFDDGWEDRWVVSKHKGASAGEFTTSAGTYYGDANDKGLKTKEDARFYQISAEFKEFSNKGKDLVVQYSVKHEQNIDCGGGYVKLLPAGLDQDDFSGDSVYNVMFGPDICGTTKRIHLIFTHKGKNHLLKAEPRAESDVLTHLYTLILKPDNSFKILVDNKEVKAGSLISDYDILPPKKIKDPKSSKPSDWVDERKIDDPDATKPEGWDDIPAQIVDKDATKPDDWDDELDGAWEAPLIDNPDFKGTWKAPKIDNPAYKGEWVHPLIDNPDYYEDDALYAFDSHKYFGIEIWQVRAGTIFDHFLVTDDIELASKEAEKVLASAEKEKEHQKEEQAKTRAAQAEDTPTETDDLADPDEGDVIDDDIDDHAGHDHVKDEL
jgi:calreticulin